VQVRPYALPLTSTHVPHECPSFRADSRPQTGQRRDSHGRVASELRQARRGRGRRDGSVWGNVARTRAATRRGGHACLSRDRGGRLGECAKD